MTPEQWNACQSPQDMLAALRAEGKASERKLRLFACAVCRSMLIRLEYETPFTIVDAGERFADGELSHEEIQSVESGLGALGGVSAAWAANCAEFAVLNEEAWKSASETVECSLAFALYSAYEIAFSEQTWTGDWEKAAASKEPERERLVLTLRDIFGNPFRPSAPLLKRHDDHVVTLAHDAYNHRTPDGVLEPARLAALADALEQASAPAEVLGHLRDEKLRHWRGCFVIDALLRKE